MSNSMQHNEDQWRHDLAMAKLSPAERTNLAKQLVELFRSKEMEAEAAIAAAEKEKGKRVSPKNPLGDFPRANRPSREGSMAGAASQFQGEDLGSACRDDNQSRNGGGERRDGLDSAAAWWKEG